MGYDQLRVEKSHVLKYRLVKDKKGEQFQIVLSRTPFYAEGGGQVGDTGAMYFEGEKILVLNTRKENDLIIHTVDKLPEHIKDPTVRCIVDAERRQLIENNHSATHLLHAALRKVLGTHVAQKGSLVSSEHLRFDFSHFEKMTDAQLSEVEHIVNQKIRENIARTSKVVTIAEAQTAGAMMLFGEKYGDVVRMVTIDPQYSIELCGGCHVDATGEIGYFKITSESAVAAGVRRIEAVTSEAAEEYFNAALGELHAVRRALNVSGSVVEKVESLQEENKRLQKRIEQFENEKLHAIQDILVKQAITNADGTKVIVAELDFGDANAQKTLCYNLEKALNAPSIIVLGAITNGKPILSVRISEELAKSKNLNAGNIVRELAKEMGGSGGGQPFFATAGGTQAENLGKALAKAHELVN